MATASLIQVPSGYSPRFSNSFRNGAYGVPLGSNSYSPSSSCCSCCSSQGLNFSSGINSYWKNQGLNAQAMNTATQGNSASTREIVKGNSEPDHLLVLVHGILASPSDWTYVEAELKKRLGKNFLIHASESNTYTKTFYGIDGAGKRLADEVMQVVKKTDSLKRISFLAHSLGGLFARYAMAVLYSENALSTSESNDHVDSTLPNSARRCAIAGLDPINFVTLATPHLGVRGRKQVLFWSYF